MAISKNVEALPPQESALGESRAWFATLSEQARDHVFPFAGCVIAEVVFQAFMKDQPQLFGDVTLNVLTLAVAQVLSGTAGELAARFINKTLSDFDFWRSVGKSVLAGILIQISPELARVFQQLIASQPVDTQNVATAAPTLTPTPIPTPEIPTILSTKVLAIPPDPAEAVQQAFKTVNVRKAMVQNAFQGIGSFLAENWKFGAGMISVKIAELIHKKRTRSN